MIKHHHWPHLHKLTIVLVIAVIIFLFLYMTQTKEKINNGISDVSKAPVTFFLYAGESKTINISEFSVLINYADSDPQQIIDILIDGSSTEITVDRAACGDDCGKKVVSGGISIIIQPVTWKKNSQGEDIWNFETWETNEIYVKIVVGE